MSRVYFISDMHLGARVVDNPREHEQRVVRFLDNIAATGADHLYMVGDVLDFWWEYRTVAPHGHLRFFGALARLADTGTQITWLKGNHDMWIHKYLAREIGLTVHDGILRTDIDGHHFLLEHGDGVGRMPRGYARMRALFRNRAARTLFGAIHPRWAIPLALGTSSHSRLSATDHLLTNEEVCRQQLDFVLEDHRRHPDTEYYIFGHVHRAFTHHNPWGGATVFLGDWFTGGSYAFWDGSHLTLHTHL